MAILLAFAPNFCYMDFHDLWGIVQTFDPTVGSHKNADRVSFNKLIEMGYFERITRRKRNTSYIRTSARLSAPRTAQRPVVQLAEELRYEALGYNPDLETKRALYGQFAASRFM